MTELIDLAQQLVGEEEGRSRITYRDSRGILTIGVGCVVDPNVLGSGLCDAAIAAQFAHDSLAARQIASAWPNFPALNPVRQAVLISMAYQLGNKPRAWPKFMAALGRQDFDDAALEGADTAWYRTETPNRAMREMNMLRSGEWVPHR